MEKRTIEGVGVTYVEGEHFKFFKEGEIEIPVANLDHPIWLGGRKKGTIQVESFNVKKNETDAGRDDTETKIQFRSAKDTDTGIFFGTVIGNEKDGRIKWKGYPLKMTEEFDLEKLEDRRNWTAISRARYIEGSPNQKGKPLYLVIDVVGRAAKRLETYKEKDRAVAIVHSLNEYEMREAGMLLGVNVRAFDPISLSSEVRDLVEKNHKNFLSIWEHPHRQINTEFIKAERLAVITRSTEAGTIYYMYNGVKLGVTKTDCVAFLADVNNVRTFSDIMLANREFEKQPAHNYKVAKVDIVPIDAKAEYERKIAALEKQLAESKKTPDGLTGTNGPLETFVGIELESMTDEALKKLGKELKVKSYQVLGREKLIEGIKLKQQV